MLANDLEQLVQGTDVSKVLWLWLFAQDCEPTACSGNPITEGIPGREGGERDVKLIDVQCTGGGGDLVTDTVNYYN